MAALPQPEISVVVPVRNGAATLARCLTAVRASRGVALELIVVDDHSDDDSADLAAVSDVLLLRLDTAGGPARARNAGARRARAPLVAFVDADVLVRADALSLLRSALDTPGVVAAFGSYDDRPLAPGLVSRWRNLLHHHTHQQARGVASTFWAGLGLVRKDAFLAVGGFDERYRRPSIEDIELGYRLGEAGGRLHLVKDAQGTHLKRWTLLGMVTTDVAARGVPWAALLLAGRGPADDLNVGRAQRISVAATGLALASAGAALGLGWAGAPDAAALALAAAGAAQAVVLLLNWRLHAFLRARRGLLFALGGVPLHLLYFTCCGLAATLALFGAGRRS